MQMNDIDFLIIGAAKSATTWLQQSLQQHPDVHMPGPELHYFSRYYDKGQDWYLANFDSDAAGKLVGEKSNSYMDTPQAAERVKKDLPQVRLIAQLRNPVERAYSDYCMLYRRGEAGRDVSQYLDPRNADGGRFLNGGLYFDQLQTFLDLFPADRLLILLFENIRSEPQRQLDMVREHLKLDASLHLPPLAEKIKDKSEAVISPGLRRILAPLKSAVRPFRKSTLFKTARSTIARELAYSPLSEDLRARLVDYYAPQVERLGALVNQDLTGWLNEVPMKQAAEM